MVTYKKNYPYFQVKNLLNSANFLEGKQIR